MWWGIPINPQVDNLIPNYILKTKQSQQRRINNILGGFRATSEKLIKIRRNQKMKWK